MTPSERASRTARRHPEAEAQIAAAREPPTDEPMGLCGVAHAPCVRTAGCLSDCPRNGLSRAMQEVDRQIEQGAAELRNTPPPPKVLTTNHPEVTDPAERERLGLEPLTAPGLTEKDAAQMARVHAAWDSGIAAAEPSPRTRPALTDDEAAAYDAFCSAAAALEEHHERAQALQGTYLGAQAKLARVAAKRVRGR